MNEAFNSDQMQKKSRARQRGGPRNVYVSHEDEQRLHRLGVGERDLSTTYHRALVLLEQQQTDYLQRIYAAVYALGVHAATGQGDRDEAVRELTQLLDNELGAKAIAMAIMQLCVEGPDAAKPPHRKEGNL